MLGEGIGDAHTHTLLRSDRAMTDCRPVSLFCDSNGAAAWAGARSRG
jgi:hypothetical protein